MAQFFSGNFLQKKAVILVRDRSEIIGEGGLQIIGEGHDFLCFEKGRVAIFSAVT